MKTWLEKWKVCLKNKETLISILFSILFFIISLVINFYASSYANEKASNSVTDIVLSNIRVFNVDGIFIFGSIAAWIFTASILLIEPKRIAFVLKSIALFVIIRSIFISLTHIGPFPTKAVMDSNGWIATLYSGSDRFFSGHTGLPFLGSLIFWENKIFRNIFLIMSLMFAIVVLLAHLHYSIDVLGAFFITYTIFHIALFLFKKDREMLSK